MPVGTPWTPGGTIGLWHINYQINSDRGFHFGVSVAEQNEAQVRAVGNDLGTRLLYLLPADAEIVFASFSKSDSPRDGRYLPAAVGAGKNAIAGSPPVPQNTDQPRTCVELRLEDPNGFPLVRKVCPIPDGVVTDNDLTVKPTNVVGLPVALPAAPVANELYSVTLGAFMQALVLQTHHVVSGGPPGGAYTYFAWANCYYMRVGSKKGGRFFTK